MLRSPLSPMLRTLHPPYAPHATLRHYAMLAIPTLLPHGHTVHAIRSPMLDSPMLDSPYVALHPRYAPPMLRSTHVTLHPRYAPPTLRFTHAMYAPRSTLHSLLLNTASVKTSLTQCTIARFNRWVGFQRAQNLGSQIYIEGMAQYPL